MTDKIHQNCCRAFDRAQQTGTDNEGYGRLITIDGEIAMIGSEMPPVDYCPWCGKAVLFQARRG